MEWTWSAVVAFAEESPALQPALDRLLKNQADIGDAVGAYYGADAGAKATDLLVTHINQAVPVLQAAMAGDKAVLDKALADWYANSQEIADFLTSANLDNCEQSAVRGMMKTHIDQTTEYANAVLAGDYAGAIETYDEAAAHMAELADALSAGIVAQFPDKFCTRSIKGWRSVASRRPAPLVWPHSQASARKGGGSVPRLSAAR